MRSQLWTSSGRRGLLGLANHGSSRIVLPPGERTSQQEWPNQVKLAVVSSAIATSLDPMVPDRASEGAAETLGYTRPVPAERIAENLAFINWTVLTGLAFGSFAAVVLARLRTDATRGFLSFTAACAVIIGVLAYLSDQALPSSLAGTPI